MGSLLCFALLLPTSVADAGHCNDLEDVRQKAECIHDTLAPDVVMQLLRLALSTLHGHSTPEAPPNDFLYVAEEAGEAARRKELKPIISLANSKDINKVVFAARAITAFLDAVEHGYSHNRRFDDNGDPVMLAKARKALRAPCSRLAGHKNSMVSADGKRCLDAIDREKGLKTLSEKPADVLGIRPVDVEVNSRRPGGLRSSQ